VISLFAELLCFFDIIIIIFFNTPGSKDPGVKNKKGKAKN